MQQNEATKFIQEQLEEVNKSVDLFRKTQRIANDTISNAIGDLSSKGHDVSDAILAKNKFETLQEKVEKGDISRKDFLNEIENLENEYKEKYANKGSK